MTDKPGAVTYQPLPLPKELCLDSTWQAANISLGGSVLTIITFKHDSMGRKDFVLTPEAVDQMIQALTDCQQKRIEAMMPQQKETVN